MVRGLAFNVRSIPHLDQVLLLIDQSMDHSGLPPSDDWKEQIKKRWYQPSIVHKPLSDHESDPGLLLHQKIPVMTLAQSSRHPEPATVEPAAIENTSMSHVLIQMNQYLYY